MIALSIRQPWAWLIVNGIKDIENRDWRYAPKFRGQFLVHASKTVDKHMHQLLLNFMIGMSALSINGLVVPKPHLEKLTKCYPTNSRLETGGIVGIAEMVDVVTESSSPWFMGPIGFVIKNARPLPFVPMNGMLNFFPASYEPPK